MIILEIAEGVAFFSLPFFRARVFSIKKCWLFGELAKGGVLGWQVPAQPAKQESYLILT
jgi:hypothetical protein